MKHATIVVVLLRDSGDHTGRITGTLRIPCKSEKKAKKLLKLLQEAGTGKVFIE